ncbi:rhodanese-like domain-containing protein [Abiotrophia sp.]
MPIAVYCNRGIKSRRVAQSLEAAGFSNIYNYTPGLKG